MATTQTPREQVPDLWRVVKRPPPRPNYPVTDEVAQVKYPKQTDLCDVPAICPRRIIGSSSCPYMSLVWVCSESVFRQQLRYSKEHYMATAETHLWKVWRARARALNLIYSCDVRPSDVYDFKSDFLHPYHSVRHLPRLMIYTTRKGKLTVHAIDQVKLQSLPHLSRE